MLNSLKKYLKSKLVVLPPITIQLHLTLTKEDVQQHFVLIAEPQKHKKPRTMAR